MLHKTIIILFGIYEFYVLECGIPAVEPLVWSATDTITYRLLNGNESKPHSWPWAVYLRICKGLNDCKSCGGCLISQTKVLTAAHCVDYGKIPVSKVKAYLGKHNLENDDDGEMRNISKIVSNSTLQKDFAILTLSKPATISDNISPICIPSTNLQPGTVCYIVGWGKTSNNGKESNVLKQTQTILLANANCSKQVHNDIVESQVCTFSSYNVSACDGDGGAPLQCKVNGYWQVHGLASYRVGSCGNNKPQVYSKVFYFDKELKDELYGV